MQWFMNLKTNAKLILGFVLVAFIAAVIGILGYLALQDMVRDEQEITGNRVPSINALQVINEAQTAILSAEWTLSNWKISDELRREQYQFLTSKWKRVDEYWSIYELLSQTKEEESLWKQFVPVWEQWRQEHEDVISLIKEKERMLQGNESEEQLLSMDNRIMTAKLNARESFDEAETLLERLVEINIQIIEDLKKHDQEKAVYTSQTIIVAIIIGVLLALLLGVFISSTINRPLKQTVVMLQELGKGHLSQRLNINRQDEIGILAATMNQFADDLQNNMVAVMRKIAEGDLTVEVPPKDAQDEIAPALKKTIETLRALIAEMDTLTQAAVAGRLDTRGNAIRFNGGYREIVQGVNDTLDAIIGPLNVAAEYVDRISKGDIPAKISDTYRGDFNEIKNNLNTCIEAVNALVTDANILATAAVEGRLDTRADATRHGGDFRKIVEGVNKTLDAVIGPLNVAAEYVDRISRGDIPPKITDTYRGDFNELKNNLNICIDAVNALVADANMLAVAAVEGRLDTRADASKHGGDFRKIVEGVNKTLDAVIGPLNVAAEYVDRISRGDIPPKITDTYRGDFNELKNNLNICIDAVNSLIADVNMLITAAMEGRLDTRADTVRHNGDFRKIVEGINKTLDAVIGPLNVAAEYVDRIGRGDIPPKITDPYRGDFNELKNNLNMCIDAINALITDADMLSRAAVDGKLSTRADVSKHGGDFAKIVAGVNDTLDAVIQPVQEASAVLQEMAKGNLQVTVKGNYRGDHAEIKEALNNTIAALKSYVGEISRTLTEMANGNLDVGINGDYRGDFIQIKESLNLIIKSFNEVLAELNNSAEQVATSSKHVSGTSQALSQGSAQQAEAVREITASINQIAAQTQQNALNANQANELAVTARQNAVQGDEQMKEMLQAMDAINEAAGNISKIIKVIDEIAFQTNILALNAAVEAARAGQHGKGFAVVAEEVRNLAARSAGAAKETTALIEGSVRKVEIGTKIANETAGALNKIVDGISRVTALVGEIAVSSNEQASGIAQVNQGVTRVARVAQANTEMADQSATASGTLSGQAEMLRGLVGRFRIKRSDFGVLKGFGGV